MTNDQRSEAESKADRALRRGELSTALGLYQSIARAFPHDADIRGKLEQVQENLQPAELSSAKSNFAPDKTGPHANPLDEAEALAAKGDHAGAIALYRQALAARPDSDLLKERLEELFQIVRAQAPRRAVLPKSPEVVLSGLLDRITARRKKD